MIKNHKTIIDNNALKMKRIQKKSAFVLIMFLAIAIAISFLSSAELKPEKEKDYNEDGNIDMSDIYYFYGNNLNSIESLDKKYLEYITEDNERLKHFMNGLSKALERRTFRYEDFIEKWIKKNQDGSYYFSDNLKNKIWKAMKKEQRKEFIQKFAKASFEKLKKENPGFFEKDYKLKLEVEGLDNENLQWKGNKLMNVDENAKPVSWIDFDNLARWVEKISFIQDTKTGESYFKIYFDTGLKKAEAVIRKGSLGPMLELIGPDGSKIGNHYNFVKKISFENNQFNVEYEINGQLKKISLSESDLGPDVSKKMKEFLLKQGFSEKFLESQQAKDIVNAILQGMSGANLAEKKPENDPELGLPTSNMISLAYGKKYSEGKKEEQKSNEIFDIDYDLNGNPNVRLMNGAYLVSTDSKGNTNAIYQQFYSRDGIVLESRSSNDYLEEHPGKIDEEAEYKFDKNGEIIASKNGKISIYRGDYSHVGDLYTSRRNMEGVAITRNTLVDGILRKDSSVIPAVLNNQELMKKISENPDFTMQDAIKEQLELLKQKIGEESFSEELKNRIATAIDESIGRIERSGEKLAYQLIFKDNSGQELSENDKIIKNAMIDRGVSAVKNAVEKLLSDPELLKRVATGDETAREKVIREALREHTGNFVAALRNSEDIKRIGDAIRANIDGNYAGQFLSQEEINKLIDRIELKESVSKKMTEPKSFIRALAYQEIEKLDTKGILLQPFKDSLANALAETVDSANKKIESFAREVKAEGEIFQKPYKYPGQEYSTWIRIDSQTGVVEYRGDDYATFDAKSPLKRVVAESTKEKDDSGNNFYLLANGNRIVSFNGEETRAYNIAPDYPFYDIERILNKRNNYELELRNGLYGYQLFDPNQLWSQGKSITGGLRWANPIVSATITKPISEDIGSNPNSKITLADATDSIGGHFGARAVRRLVQKNLPEGFPTAPMADKVSETVAEVLGKAAERAGGKENFDLFVNEAYNVISRNNNRNSPAYDYIYTAKNIDGFYAMLNFIKENSAGRGNYLEITPRYISVNGVSVSEYIGRDGARHDMTPIIRTYMRMFDQVANSPDSPFRHYHPSEARGM